MAAILNSVSLRGTPGDRSRNLKVLRDLGHNIHIFCSKHGGAGRVEGGKISIEEGSGRRGVELGEL